MDGGRKETQWNKAVILAVTHGLQQAAGLLCGTARHGDAVKWRFTLRAIMTVRTRFAPSPTGYLHLGGARTALFSWAYARRFGGVFILRVEDTDLERSTPEAVQAILDGMQWLGLQHDEGPFYQMRRMDRYREVVAQMLETGSAYYCYSSPQEVE